MTRAWTYVADANALGLAGGGQGLHLLPAVDVVPVTEDVTRAVGQGREAVVVACAAPLVSSANDAWRIK